MQSRRQSLDWPGSVVVLLVALLVVTVMQVAAVQAVCVARLRQQVVVAV